MRQQFADTVDVQYGCGIRVIDGSLHFVLLDVFADELGQLGVDLVAGACRNDASTQGFAYQGQVTNHVDQFVTSRFVVEHQWLRVEVTQLLHVHVRNLHHVGQPVQRFLRDLLVVNNNCIV